MLIQSVWFDGPLNSAAGVVSLRWLCFPTSVKTNPNNRSVKCICTLNSKFFILGTPLFRIFFVLQVKKKGQLASVVTVVDWSVVYYLYQETLQIQIHRHAPMHVSECTPFPAPFSDLEKKAGSKTNSKTISEFETQTTE
jgi:hypothetical protein